MIEKWFIDILGPNISGAVLALVIITLIWVFVKKIVLFVKKESE